MTHKPWFLVTLASFALLGCAGTQEQLAAECTPGICKVEVRVADCAVTVSPETLLVKLPRGAKNIDWDLISNDYMFAANGIVIANPADEFDQPSLSAGGRKFKFRDRHTVANTYKYTVNVVRAGDDPRNCPPHDPYIANE